MTRSRLAMAALLAGTLAADAAVIWAVFGAGRHPAGWPYPGVLMIYALALSQVTLVTLWGVLSGARPSWRLLGGMLVMFAWSLLLGGIELPDRSAGSYAIHRQMIPAWWMGVFLAQALFIAVSMALVRKRGLRLPVGRPREDRGDRPVQFTIRDMLVLTALVALGLGLGAGLLLAVYWYSVLAPTLVLVAAGGAAIALAAIWSILGAPSGGRGAGNFCLAIAVAAACLLAGFNLRPLDRPSDFAIVMPRYPMHAGDCVTLAALQGLLTLASLGVIEKNAAEALRRYDSAE
jgi:hypothetical protein